MAVIEPVPEGIEFLPGPVELQLPVGAAVA